MRNPIEVKVGAIWENVESSELFEVLAVETSYVCLRGPDDRRFWEPKAVFGKVNNLYVLPEFWESYTSVGTNGVQPTTPNMPPVYLRAIGSDNLITLGKPK